MSPASLLCFIISITLSQKLKLGWLLSSLWVLWSVSFFAFCASLGILVTGRQRLWVDLPRTYSQHVGWWPVCSTGLVSSHGKNNCMSKGSRAELALCTAEQGAGHLIWYGKTALVLNLVDRYIKESAWDSYFMNILMFGHQILVFCLFCFAFFIFYCGKIIITPDLQF